MDGRRVESDVILMWGVVNTKGDRKMERMSDYEWFCANCLRMVETLSRHGRCPYCDSNAVDVAYRWSQREASHSGLGTLTTELVGAQQ